MTNAALLELLDRSDQIHNYVKHYKIRPGKLYEILLREPSAGVGYSIHGTRTFRLKPTMINPSNEQQIENLTREVTQKRGLVDALTYTIKGNVECIQKMGRKNDLSRRQINDLFQEIKQLEDQIADLRKRVYHTYKIGDIFKRAKGHDSQNTYMLTRITRRGVCLVGSMTNDQYASQGQNYSDEITDVVNINVITVEELKRIMAGNGATFASCDPSRPLPWE